MTQEHGKKSCSCPITFPVNLMSGQTLRGMCHAVCRFSHRISMKTRLFSTKPTRLNVHWQMQKLRAIGSEKRILKWIMSPKTPLTDHPGVCSVNLLCANNQPQDSCNSPEPAVCHFGNKLSVQETLGITRVQKYLLSVKDLLGWTYFRATSWFLCLKFHCASVWWAACYPSGHHKLWVPLRGKWNLSMSKLGGPLMAKSSSPALLFTDPKTWSPKPTQNPESECAFLPSSIFVQFSHGI